MVPVVSIYLTSAVVSPGDIRCVELAGSLRSCVSKAPSCDLKTPSCAETDKVVSKNNFYTLYPPYGTPGLVCQSILDTCVITLQHI
jgi:hypothetical protein